MIVTCAGLQEDNFIASLWDAIFYGWSVPITGAEAPAYYQAVPTGRYVAAPSLPSHRDGMTMGASGPVPGAGNNHFFSSRPVRDAVKARNGKYLNSARSELLSLFLSHSAFGNRHSAMREDGCDGRVGKEARQGGAEKFPTARGSPSCL